MQDLLPFGAYGFGIAISVVAIMLSICGIALGLGYALDDRRLKEFGKSEMQQAIINAALVGGFLVLFSSNGIVTLLVNEMTGSVAGSFSCPAYISSNSALCFSYNYLVGLSSYTINGASYGSLFSIISELLIGLLSFSTVLGIIAGFKINLLVISLSFGSVLAPILSQVQYLIGVLFTLSLGITVQSALISFVSATATTILLPLGLILRSFYVSRKLGGFLIALSIGLYVVLPLSYVLNASMLSSYSQTNSTQLAQLISNANSVKDQISASNLAYNQTNNGIFGLLSSTLEQIEQSANQILNQIMLELSKLIMEIFILPAFSLIITGISVRELSELLGSEAAFGRFKILQ